MQTQKQKEAQRIAAENVKGERIRQEALREQRHWGSLEGEDNHVLNTVLTEETGEVAKAILEYSGLPDGIPDVHAKALQSIIDEAAHVGAVASQIAEKAIMHLQTIREFQAAAAEKTNG